MDRCYNVTAADGLRLAVTTAADNAVFRTFWQGYEKAFVLPDEMEDEAGFRQCLALNDGKVRRDLVARYGQFCEVCVVLRDGDKVIGGANFLAAPFHEFVTLNLNYVYVDAACRGRGYLRRVIAALTELSAGLFASTSTPLIFFEQNDPLAMSEDAYRHDSEHSGLDQMARAKIWAHLGARVLDFDYVQPPLAPGRRADRTLLYCVLGCAEDRLAACILQAHLQRFFGISVLKGRPLNSDAEASRQIAWLSSACDANDTIGLIDLMALLLRLEAEGPAGHREKSLRAAYAALP